MPIPLLTSARAKDAWATSSTRNLDLKADTPSTTPPTKGSAPAVLIPAYSIFRAVPQLHGVYQYWRFSFDEQFIGRYLFLTENSATQSKANVVYPERLTGWKGINKLNWSYKTNPTGAFSLSLTYTDGFDAPKFKRTNSVLAGLTFMY